MSSPPTGLVEQIVARDTRQYFCGCVNMSCWRTSRNDGGSQATFELKWLSTMGWYEQPPRGGHLGLGRTTVLEILKSAAVDIRPCGPKH